MTAAPIVVAPPTPENYLTVDYGVRSWLLTKDHKRIGILYLLSITFFFFIGGAAATMLRLHLMTPHGEMLSADNPKRNLEHVTSLRYDPRNTPAGKTGTFRNELSR